MIHVIKVDYKLATNPEKRVEIPVRYSIVEDHEQCTKTVFCRVDLPYDAIPAWLSPISFKMVNHYKSGMHVINYNDKEVSNLDAEFFRYKLYADIMLAQRLKDQVEMEHC